MTSVFLWESWFGGMYKFGRNIPFIAITVALACLIRPGTCLHNGTDHGPRPPPPPPRDHANTQSADAGLSAAEIAGIVIGCVSAIAAIVGTVCGVRAYHRCKVKAGNSKSEGSHGIKNSCCACIFYSGNEQSQPTPSPPPYSS